ncbi:MAG: nucleoside 2-deoxyribosyltransferase [Bacteroidales bacterium]
MKIYFAGSITGGRGDVEIYKIIIEELKKYGEVLTEFIGDESLSSNGEGELNDKFIHDRDLNWLFSAGLVVAEITTPSLGVGYEIGRALENGKKILCLYRQENGRRISAMIKGAPGITVFNYTGIEHLKQILKDFFLLRNA